MRKPGIKNRQLAGQLRREQFEVGDSIRSARNAALAQFNLRRLKAEADDRVQKARDKLERVDVFGLRAELEAAIQSQADIDAKLVALQANNVLMAG